MSPDRPANESLAKLFRRQRRQAAALFAVVLVGLFVLGLFANAAYLAGRDSSNATKAQLTSDVRSACITARRSVQFDHLGGMQVHMLRALAALTEDDDATFSREVALGLEEADAWEVAVETLAPDVVNEPPPVGCGPPVLTLDQLNDKDEP